MQSMPNPNFEILKSLSSTLGTGISAATQESRRAKEQLDALIHSKGLVDESLQFFASNTGSAYQNPAQSTFFPTGSLVLPIAARFTETPPGSGRSLISAQIQSTLQAGLSAYISAIQPEASQRSASLQQLLTTHNEVLLSLEERLASRLAVYSGHLVAILRGALESYRDAGNPLRFSNAGTALRELIREYLAEVAPDQEVKKAPWFVPADDSKNGVTRRHRIDYAIVRNLTKDKFPKTFTDQADATASDLLKDIEKLSAFTHVTERILEKNHTEAGPLFSAVMQRFLLLVSAIETARMLVEEEIEVELQSYLDDIFTGEFFDDLDCLSSHTRVASPRFMYHLL